MLELKNVTKIYKSKSGNVGALNGVSITLPESGLVFITGKSGCGKTTLLNVIGGLDGIDSGEISLLGKSFDTFTPADYDDYRNTFIGFIFQEYNLLSEYTVEKNIEIAMELQGRKSDKAELDALLEEMEIGHLRTRKPMELSGGQRQRVAIARALVKKPRIIMADEPTGALDSKTGIQVLEILKKLSKDKLIIIVSHDDELASRYADRIIRLIDGVVDSDITYHESAMVTNVTESEKTVLIRAGADLSNEEKDTVAKAVKESKKLELINNLSLRKVETTDESKIKKTTEKVQLTSSKMKLKSSVTLGVKSLAVKPIRLAFTILLAVIAFAVFGLFDTVANFSTAKVINNLLRTTSSSVALYGEYIENDIMGDKYFVKLSEEKIKEISRETGLPVKGVYDFNENSGMIATSYIILEHGGFEGLPGKDYYSRLINGFIEFDKTEIKDDKISEFGYEIVEGRYPALNYEYDSAGKLVVTEESLSEVAISTYMAESLVLYLTDNGNFPGWLNGKTIEKTTDLLGAKFTLNAKKYTIVGLIDCGAIPKKYEVLKEQYAATPETNLLITDMASYVDSGAYKCLFVPKGHRQEILAKNNEIDSYFGGNSASWTVNIPGVSYVRRASKFLYSANDFYNDSVVFFNDDTKKDQTAKVSLADNEILVHANNLKAIFEREISLLIGALKTDAEFLANAVADESLTKAQKLENLDKFFKAINITEAEAKERMVDVVKQSTKTDVQTNNKLKVVGVYFGVDLNDVPSSTEIRMLMNDNLLSTYNVCLDQGEYSKFIVNPTVNTSGTSIISDYMLNDEGLSLVWFGNFALQTIESNEAVIRQGADLFLYISLALAAFSVFMLFNYIVTSIVNKQPTIGVLRGLGSRGRDVLRIFLAESIIIALINAVVATLFTALGAIFVNNYIMNVMNIAVPFALFGIRQVGIIFGLSVATAIVSSTLPIIKIAKKKPVDLIRTI